jgi:hypothetical protein
MFEVRLFFRGKQAFKKNASNSEEVLAFVRKPTQMRV